MTDRGARARARATRSPQHDGDDAIATLWLEVQQRITARATHEVKNALNGVAVNLEVVRSRLGRAGVEPSAVARYADAGMTQFETLTALVEAILSVTRPVSGTVDLLALLAPIVTLLGAAARPDGGGIVVSDRGGEHGSAPTGSDARAARLALAAALLAALEATSSVRCDVNVLGAAGTIVRIGGDAQTRLPPLEPRIVDAVTHLGIRVEQDAGIVQLTFAPPRGATIS